MLSLLKYRLDMLNDIYYWIRDNIFYFKLLEGRPKIESVREAILPHVYKKRTLYVDLDHTLICQVTHLDPLFTKLNLYQTKGEDFFHT